MPGLYNITLRQGDTYTETFTFKDTLLTGYTGLMQIRDQSGAVKVTCDSDASPSTMTITVGAADSIVAPLISAVQTAALSPGVYYYDLELTSPSSIVTTYLEGKVTVDADVTEVSA